MYPYRSRTGLRTLWKMLVRDVLAALVQADPAAILADAPGRALEYDPVARRVVRRLIRGEVASETGCSAVLTEEIDRILRSRPGDHPVQAVAAAVWERWSEIVKIDQMLARWRESS